jgi:membrane associated rhomboid family serine protease
VCRPPGARQLSAVTDEEGRLPPGPTPLALLVAMQLVTRYRLRLTDRNDSRLGPLGSAYELGAAAWTGRTSAFVGFYTPPADGALEDLSRRLADAWSWGQERLRLQGAERCSILLVALSPIPGQPPSLPPPSGPLRVGAVSVDATTGAVTPLTPMPPGLPGVGELRAAAATVVRGEPVPTLAAVDLAERQTVAGGYAAPARRALTVTQPYVAYALIGIWLLVWILETATKKTVLVGGVAGQVYPVADALGLVAGSHAHTDWWTIATVGFVHDPSSFTHILFNGLAMYWIGTAVERLYGPWVLLGTFLGSVVGASLFFIAATDSGVDTGGAVVGASGGIAGLVGLLLVLGRVQGRDVPVGLVSSLRQYAMVIIAINIVFGFASKNVSNTGHLGGLISGALIGLVLPPLRGIGGRDLTLAEKVAIGVVTAFCAVALAYGAVQAHDAVNAAASLGRP